MKMKGHRPQSKGDVTSETALLLGPTDGAVSNGGCLDWLSGDRDGDDRVLLITYSQSPDELIDRWTRQVGSLPSDLGIIAVGEHTRSTAAPTGRRQRSSPGILTTVASPADLAGLGIAICTYLEEWSEAGGVTALCFHSLTDLLRATGVEATFKFLVILRHRLTDVDVVAHFHLDPAEHTDQTIAQLREVFDTVVEPDSGAGGPRTEPRGGFSPADVRAILYNQCRLQILRFLLAEQRPVSVRELADRVARFHHEAPTEDDIELAHIALVHNHLPLLADYDLVAIYGDGSRVEALDRAHEFVSQVGSLPASADTTAPSGEDNPHDQDDPD